MRFITLIFLTISFCCFATPQEPDLLFYNGEYIIWTGSSPGLKMFEEKGFEPPPEAIETTSLWRRFMMIYTIENDTLFLVDVDVLISVGDTLRKSDETPYLTIGRPPKIERKPVFKYYFPDGKRIPMLGFNEIVEIPYGDLIFTEENNRTRIDDERFYIFEFVNGVVKKKYDLALDDRNRYKDRLVDYYLETTKYEQQKDSLMTVFARWEDIITYREYLRRNIFGLIDRLK